MAREAEKSVNDRAREAIPIPEQGGDRKSRGYQGSNRTLKARGTTADYLTARIARKHKDILERMKAGEFSITPTCAGASTKAGQAGRKSIIPLLIPRKVKETFLPACPVTTTDSILLKASRVPRK